MKQSKIRLTARALKGKYQELSRLRRGVPAADAREAMTKLAACFPGALRQLDRFPLTLIADRLAGLDAVLQRDAPIPTWASWEVAYHGRLRAALRVKRALMGDPSEDDAMARGARAWGERGSGFSSLGAPEEPFGQAHLDAIRRPPGGRLGSWVLTEVAQAVGTSAEDLRRVLFAPLSDDDDGG